MEPSDHLFRREAGRMVATLTRIFGVHNLALAEDVVQDAFCRALEVWKFRGVPENPSAWLMATAKNRALDVLRRERTARTFAPELGRLLESEGTLAPAVEELFRAERHQGRSAPHDVLLLPSSAARGGAGRAGAAHPVRIQRGRNRRARSSAATLPSRSASPAAKRCSAASKRFFDIVDAADFAARLPSVHRALYLLFNEGYHGASPESAVRAELCQEAMRLAALLLQHPLAATPATHALAALMCLHAARLPARVDAAGNLSSLFDQDRSRWDQELVAEGQRLLDLSATGQELTEYHLEAAIAAFHAMAPRTEDTDWGTKSFRSMTS